MLPLPTLCRTCCVVLGCWGDYLPRCTVLDPSDVTDSLVDTMHAALLTLTISCEASSEPGREPV